MKLKNVALGLMVMTNRAFVDVPKNTLGVIDSFYDGGVMVAWDLEDRPLPANYARAVSDGIINPTTMHNYTVMNKYTILRDGFGYDELKFLEPIEYPLKSPKEVVYNYTIFLDGKYKEEVYMTPSEYRMHIKQYKNQKLESYKIVASKLFQK